MIEITTKNKIKNGKSANTSKLALVMKSRTDSKSRKLFAYEPEDVGFSSKRNAITRRNNAELIIKSAFLPAISVKCPRTHLVINSNMTAINTPILNAHSVSYD